MLRTWVSMRTRRVEVPEEPEVASSPRRAAHVRSRATDFSERQSHRHAGPPVSKTSKRPKGKALIEPRSPHGPKDHRDPALGAGFVLRSNGGERGTTLETCDPTWQRIRELHAQRFGAIRQA